MPESSGRPFLTAEWRYLAMFNYEIAPGILQPLVPPHTELDTFNGRALVSLIGFRFLDTRILGFPIPFHRNFVEVNLRFYVKREAPDGWHHGVVFIKEMVPKPAIALAARALYNEPYHTLPMRHHVNMAAGDENTPGSVRYGWRFRKRWQHMEISTSGRVISPASGSEAEFISVRHWGYGTHRDGSGIEYRVTHPRWSVWKAHRHSMQCDIAGLYGPQFAEPLHHPPSSAFVADGSAVSVYPARRLGP